MAMTGSSRCLAALMLSLAASGVAFADEGECGLEAGLWAKSAAVCASLQQSGKSAVDDRTWLEWHRGYYVYESTNCSIFSSKVTGPTCRMRIECSRVMGDSDIEIVSKREMKFGTDTFVHCGKANP
jgi:hypothetical protein